MNEEIFPEDNDEEDFNWQAAQHQDRLMLQKRVLDDLVALYYDAACSSSEAHSLARILECCQNIAAGLGILKEFNQAGLGILKEFNQAIGKTNAQSK